MQALVAGGLRSLRQAKTFNNPFNFERGLWQRQSGWFEDVPITRVFGRDCRFVVPPLPILKGYAAVVDFSARPLGTLQRSCSQS